MTTTGAKPGHTDREATVDLLARARQGDRGALETVFARAMPPLRRWARGRLPGWARRVVDTDDLVQDTVIGTLRHIDVFEYREDGALQAYLRQAVMNRIRNEVRRAHRNPAPAALDSGVEADDLSPLEALVGKRTLEAYDRALATLSPTERELVIARVDLGMSHADIARAQGRPSAAAARMAVGRALLKLARALDDHSGPR